MGAPGPAAAPGRRRASRLPLVLVLGFPVALFLLAGLRAVQLAREGEVPSELRDLDCDGRIDFAEWLRGGIDYRLRDSAAVPGCREIYAVKTGRALVLRCPDEPRCRPAFPARAPAPPPREAPGPERR